MKSNLDVETYIDTSSKLLRDENDVLRLLLKS